MRKKKTAVEHFGAFWARAVLPLAFLYAGVTRVSCVSFAYLCLFFAVVSWGRGRPTPAGFTPPCLAAVLALGSLALKACALRAVALPRVVLVLFGLAARPGRATPATALYFVADLVVLVVAVVLIALLAVAAHQHRSRHQRHQLDAALRSELSRASSISPAGSPFLPDAPAMTPAMAPPSKSKQQNKGNKKDKGEYEDDEEEEDDDEKETNSEPKRLHVLWNISLRRALAALLVAAAAAAFVPSVLALPYAVFCLVAVLYLGLPRREHTRLSLPILVNVTGLFLALYTFLHVTVIYAYQIYYNYNTLAIDENSNSSEGSLSNEGEQLKDMTNDFSNEYLGLFSYDTFLRRERWPVIVSYVLLFLLYAVLAPVNRCVRRVTDAQAEAHNRRFYEDGATEVLVFLADQLTSQDTGDNTTTTANNSRARLVGARAVYPHAWKLAMLALLGVALVSGGILMAVLLAGVLAGTVARPYRSAKWGVALFLYYVAFVFVDYVLNVPEPLALWLHEHYPEHMRDLSLAYQSRAYCGLFFGLHLWLALLLAMFVRLRNEYVLHHALLKKIARTRAALRSSELDSLRPLISGSTGLAAAASVSVAAMAHKDGGTGNGDDDASSSSSADGFNNYGDDDDDESADEEDRNAANTIGARLRHIGARVRMWGVSAASVLKALLTRLVINLIRYSYILSLIFLYFVSIRGINAINFVFMAFFLVFACKPALAKRSWNILVHFSEAILLLRFLWQLHWIPDNNTVTNIIGLNKDRSQLAISTLVWEALLVVFVTIQMYIIDIEEESLARERSRKYALSANTDGPSSTTTTATTTTTEQEGQQEQEQQTEEGTKKNQVLSPQEVLSSWSKDNALPLLDRVVGVLEFWVRTRGLYICTVVWMLMGTLMPISVVSLSFVAMAMVCTLALFHTRNPAAYVRQVWMLFLVWLAVVLFAEYSYQLPDLQRALSRVYRESRLNDYIGIDELGLTQFESAQTFVGMLPYVTAFVIAVMQWNFFSLERRDTTLPDGAVPRPLLGVVDFVRRFVFVYTPFVAFVFAAAHFINAPSAARMLFLLVILLSRFSRKGFDRVGGLVVWGCHVMVFATLVFNMRAFDFAALAHPRLFKWIGLPHQYVPTAGSTRPHTENIAMTYEYIVLVALMLLQRVSLRWGEDVAFHIHWVATTPRAMPLLAFLDKYPTWKPARKDRHAWHGFLFTLCDLPNLLTRQACYFLLCLLFYVRSPTFMGLWYLVGFTVCCNCARRTARKLAGAYVFVDIVLILGQYLTMLGWPTRDAWPWVDWNPELQRWLLLYVPYPKGLVLDVVLLYFLSASMYLGPSARDVYAIIKADPDDTAFLNRPRTALNEFRYIFLTFSVVVLMLVLFFVASSKACIISLVFLVGSVVLMYKGDFLLHNTRPWNVMALCLYAMCFLQLVFQPIVAVLRHVNGAATASTLTDTVIYVAGFLGISYTEATQLLADSAALFLFGLLLVLSVVRSMTTNLAHEFYAARIYTAEMRVATQRRALAYLRHSVDAVIAYVEAVYADRLKRRERLEALRESRKRKQLLFPDLVAEIDDDTASSCGGSYLSAEEARYQREDLAAAADRRQNAKAKLTVRAWLRRVGRALAAAWFWCTDHVIFWLHGRQGQVDGAHYARDLQMLRTEREERHRRRVEDVGDGEGCDSSSQDGNGADGSTGEQPTGTVLTQEALSQLTASLNTRDFVDALIPYAEQNALGRELGYVPAEFVGAHLMISSLCHMDFGPKIGNMKLFALVKRLKNQAAAESTTTTTTTEEEQQQEGQEKTVKLGEQLNKMAEGCATGLEYEATDIPDMTLAELCCVVERTVRESKKARTTGKDVTVRDFFIQLGHLFPPSEPADKSTEAGRNKKKGHRKSKETAEPSFIDQRRNSVFTPVFDEREDSDSGAEEEREDAMRDKEHYFGRKALQMDEGSYELAFHMRREVSQPQLLVKTESRTELPRMPHFSRGQQQHDEDDDSDDNTIEVGFGNSRAPSRSTASPVPPEPKKEEQEEKEQEYVRRSRWRLFWKGVITKVEGSSENICLIAFVLNHILHGTLVSFVYVLFGFGYVALAKRPNPKKPFWNFIMVYTAVVILLKFVVKLPGVCLCRTARTHIWSFSYHNIFATASVQCPEAACLVDSGRNSEYFSLPYLVGVVPSTDSFWREVVMDVVVLLAVVFHRLLMDKQGLWTPKMEHERAMENARYLARKNELSSNEVTASPTHVVATCDVVGKNEHFLSFTEGTHIRVLCRGRATGANSIGEIDGATGLFDISLTKPAPATSDDLVKGDDYLDEELGFSGRQFTDDDDEHKTLLEKEKMKKKNKDKDKEKDKDKKKKNSRKEKIKNSTMGKFYEELIHDDTRVGHDYYAAMFTVEFVSLVYLLVFGALFTGASGSLTEYISQSYLPGTYVFLLVLQFALIILDRIVYICRSLLWKIVLQYVTLVGVTLITLFWFPYKMDLDIDVEAWHAPFTQSAALQLFFVLKCVYWFLSALQIRDGYPVVSGDRFLMRRYSTLDNWVHQGYRAIPFLFELRTVLDWTFIPTTLDFFDYLRVEDIYADVYKVACLAAARTHRRPGTNRACGEKCGIGCLLFLLLAAVLWLPLVVLSTTLPGVGGIGILPVTRAAVRVQLHGYAPLYSAEVTDAARLAAPLSAADFAALRRGRAFIQSAADTLQPLALPPYSDTLWKIPYAAKAQLAALLDRDRVTVDVALAFARPSQSNAALNVTYRTPLARTDAQRIAAALRAGRGASTTYTGLFPRFLKMPGSSGSITSPCYVESTTLAGTSANAAATTSGISTITSESTTSALVESGLCVPVTVRLTYHGCFTYGCAENSTEEEGLADYWSIEQVPEDPSAPDAPALASAYFNRSDALQLVLVHVPASKTSNVIGTLAAYGLIGIYATIILAIARLVRTLMSGQTADVMFICLPDPLPLVRLSKDIILARMDGDLLLEEQLANELIQMYRSPEAIIENTRIVGDGTTNSAHGHSGDAAHDGANDGGGDDDVDSDDGF